MPVSVGPTHRPISVSVSDQPALSGYWISVLNPYRSFSNKNKNIKNIKGVMLWSPDVCSRAAFAQSWPVSSISLGRFFSVSVRRG